MYTLRQVQSAMIKSEVAFNKQDGSLYIRYRVRGDELDVKVEHEGLGRFYVLPDANQTKVKNYDDMFDAVAELFLSAIKERAE